MSAIVNLLGSPPFGRLTVIASAETTRSGQTQWLCQCECGEFTVVRTALLRNGTTQSCGCLGRETREAIGRRSKIHGMYRSPEYWVFHEMLTRCRNPRRRAYRYYGGRGIRVLFESFAQFYAEVGPRPSPQHTIDRIDTNGHYAPGNVRWTTQAEQMRNSRRTHLITYQGKSQCLTDWAKELSLPRHILTDRLRTWTVEAAFTTPIRRNSLNCI